MFDFRTVFTAPQRLAVLCLGAGDTVGQRTVTTAHARLAGTGQ
jgi:hypothetical protein